MVMGVVNVTPDSFSDGGRFLDTRQAIDQGLRLRAEGADLLDIGGESTRPGAQPVPLQVELERVLPVIEGLQDCGAALSVDTMKPEVMAAALASGADMVNDVKALETVGALQAVAASQCGICLVHMQGAPRSMQANPHYHDVVAEVSAYLRERLTVCEQAGVDASRIVIDPGFGFGKTLAHNVALFKKIHAFADIAPVMVGVSRKAMIGAMTGQPVDARLVGSVTAALLAAMRGAAILRVHDVRATVDALKTWQALGDTA
jgi:dihydropteroate synthase